MLISMAMIGDHDGLSGVTGYTLDEPSVTNSPGNDFGVVATQLLDSPKATSNVDLVQDGTIDIFPGEPLKMTDWHWVDWYQRPGVVSPESNSSSCYAGSEGCPVAKNKEELSAEPTEPLVHNPEAEEKQKFEFHISSKREETAMDRIYARINNN